MNEHVLLVFGRGYRLLVDLCLISDFAQKNVPAFTNLETE
jgi:hypothetical protein